MHARQALHSGATSPTPACLGQAYFLYSTNRDSLSEREGQPMVCGDQAVGEGGLTFIGREPSMVVQLFKDSPRVSGFKAY